jgi:hypothetical protein
VARVPLAGITLTVAKREEPCSTSVGAASEHVLGISSVLPGRHLELVSCYLLEPRGAIGASHLLLAACPSREDIYRLVPAAELLGSDPSCCLLDHAAELRDVLAGLHGEPVTVDVPVHALAQLARVTARDRQRRSPDRDFALPPEVP